MNDLVSVIIPAYNIENYIGDCLRSIVNQDYKNLQIIVINDGSSDRTIDEINKWKKKDVRIEVLDQPNGGVSNARNNGIVYARGEYIIFVDGDDYMLNTSITEIVDQMSLYSLDALMYGYSTVFFNGKIGFHDLSYYDKELYITQDEVINCVLEKSFGISGKDISKYLETNERIKSKKDLNGPWRICYKTKIIKDNSIRFDPTLSVGEDTIFTIEYLSFCSKVKIYNRSLYFLKHREDSTTQKQKINSKKVINDKLKLINKKTELTRKIYDRTKIECHNLWGGEYLLSVIQIGNLLLYDNKLKLLEKYNLYRGFYTNRLVKEKIIATKIKYKLSLKSLAVFLVKNNPFILYILLYVAKFLHISIEGD